VLLIVALGLVLAWRWASSWGLMLTGLYAEFFRFPRFDHLLDPGWC
jgi:putative ABC transport system permease protein